MSNSGATLSSTTSLDAILLKVPNLLTAAEKALPDDRRNALIKQKLNTMLKQEAAKKANNAGANPAGGSRPNGGNVGVVRPPQQGSGQGGAMGQSPRMVMPQQGQMQGQGQQGMMMPGQNQPGQMTAAQQQSYQEQMRLQQQHQQQQHQQRLQAAQAQAQAQLQAQALDSQVQNGTMLPPQQPHPSNNGMTAPSPQQQAAQLQQHGSPMTNANGRSPASGPNRANVTPAMGNVGLPNPAANPNVKALIDNFPKLLEAKRHGRLGPEQERLFDHIMSSEAGRAQLSQVQAQQASALIQNNLSNPIQMPQITPQQQQLQLAAHQQQLAQLQQQQQQQLNMQGFVPQQGMMPNPTQQQQQQQQQPQLTPQQIQQQIQFRQLAQQQQQQNIRPPPNPTQAQQIARAQAVQAQTQLMQAAQQMGHSVQQNQQGQMGMMDGGSTPGYGSPRPPSQPNQRTQIPPDKVAVLKATLTKLASMNEAQRESHFQQRPQDRQFWTQTVEQNRNVLQQQAQHQQMMQNQARPPPNGAANGNGGNFTGINANGPMPNLHIPPSKQRNLSQGNIGSPAASTPPMRPTMPLQNQANQAAAIQRMINQGIPVNVANVVRPPMNAQGQGQLMPGVPGGPEIKPYMLLQQMKAQQGASEHPHPSAVRQISEQVMPPLDRTGSLLSRATWTPTSEYDAALREKLTEFKRPIKPMGRPSLSQGLGVTRILGDVVLEQMPEGLAAITEDAEGLAGDKKKVEEGSGMPGQKKRKVSELASTVDKQLEIDHNVETVMLQFGDEHAELIGNLTCLLAKHRKSDTIDRKDIQLAYEMTEPRCIPGFSSDLIRLDQARSTKRAGAPVTQNRINKLKLVADARASFRKSNIASREQQHDERQSGLEGENHGGEGSGEFGGQDPTVRGDVTRPIPPQPTIDGPVTIVPPATVGITA